MINRIEEIKKKGFNMPLDNNSPEIEDVRIPTDFNKIRVGIKTLQDATINVGSYKKVNPRLSDDIERQINPNYNLKKENFNAKAHDVYYNEKTDANVSMISLYDGTQKKINIHKFNSITYIKRMYFLKMYIFSCSCALEI